MNTRHLDLRATRLAVGDQTIQLEGENSRLETTSENSVGVQSIVRNNEIRDAIPKKPRRRVMISIPTGFQLRQFVHSGVLDLILQRGFDVLIASPNGNGEGFTAELTDRDVEIHPLLLQSQGSLSWRYWLVRQYLFLHGRPTETQKQYLGELHRRRFWLTFAAQCGNRLLGLSPRLRKRALGWEHWLLRDRAVDTLFSRYSIDLVLLGSPGFNLQDAILSAAAVRRGTPVAAAVTSWDNLSSKGLINPCPDRLLVWSDHMRSEAIQLQRIPSERIAVTGASLYDVFANSDRFGTRSENLRRLGLDVDRKLILYGTNHAGFFPDEVEVVKRIAKWVEEDALGMPCQLWVRLHPQAVTGPYKLSLKPYLRLSSNRVKVEFPPIRDGNMMWDFPEDDLEHLVGLLRDADVLINTASTLSIDAAVLDRPVICVSYDPSGNLPYDRSVRRYYDFTHMAHVVQAGAVQLASSPEELRQKIITYLGHPELDREGRKRIVKQQFGKVDGASSERLVETILKMLPKSAA